MNLSSLVHGSRHHQHQFTEIYSSSYPASREHIMASSLVANPYTTQPAGQVVNYAYVSAPQAPPSPPIDETSKCSLPSISSLLGLADAGSPEGSPQQQPQQSQPSSPPHNAQQQELPQQAISQQHVMVDYRQNQRSQYDVPTPISIPRGALPPTPPMQMDSGFDGRQSPSGTSSSQYSVSSAPGYYFHQPGSAINNVEPTAQRQHVTIPVRRRATIPQQASLAYQPSPFSTSQYAMSPSQQSMSSYYGSPMQQTSPPQQISGLYCQRPLPQFPPSVMPVSVSLAPSSGTNPWQHHHYISPSSQASFPQSQDRYICQTCQKAFSRPSSLRIHSHSHTGEKPFKCPHQGCGKAFSVRSNMKRHERGCHTFENHGSLQ